MRTVLIGESHSAAFRRLGNDSFQAFMLSKQKNGRTIGDVALDTLPTVIGSLTESDLVASAVGGNQYAILGTIQHERPFDVMEGAEAVQPGCELIPVRVMESVFEERLKEKEEAKIRAIKDATKARVVHLSPPPPKEDNDFILKHHETLFAKEGIAVAGVSSPELRLKLWKIQDRMIRRMCDQIGVAFIPPPTEAVMPSGF